MILTVMCLKHRYESVEKQALIHRKGFCDSSRINGLPSQSQNMSRMNHLVTRAHVMQRNKNTIKTMSGATDGAVLIGPPLS
jgi:hypothetical protein